MGLYTGGVSDVEEKGLFMSNSLDKLKALTSRLEEQLSQKEARSAAPAPKADTPVQLREPVSEPVVEKKAAEEHRGFDSVREENIEKVRSLFQKLKIFEKSPDFNDIFKYKAMNLSGIGLKEEDFGEIREGKYIQIIAITYEPDKNGKKKAKNLSLGYFGKAETLDPTLKNEIIEFVLRWRYEKAFQNVEHYKDLIARIETPKKTLF